MTKQVNFINILKDLHTLVTHETRLLKENRVTQAMSLLPEKERLVQIIDTGRPPIDLLSDEEIQTLKELSLSVSHALEENQQALSQTHNSHENFIQFCIHTVQNLRPLSYDKQGSITAPKSDSMGITKNF